MEITREFLEEQRKALEIKRLEAIGHLNQVAGAITMLNVMQARLDAQENVVGIDERKKA